MKGFLGIAGQASIRYLGSHPWLTALSVLGIALGVAVVVSIDIANSSAQRAFELSSARVAGKTTHQVVAPESIDGEVYRRLRVEGGIRRSAPIVEGYAERGGRTYHVLGIDPFADRAFRSYTSDLQDLDLGAFFGTPPAVLVPPSVGAAPGDTLHLSISGRSAVVGVAGVLVPEDEMSREATLDLIVTDVGTAQHLYGLGGRLTRIDLILDDEEEVADVEAVLPPGVSLVRSSARTEAVEQMTAAFELNLNALSMLALVVAMFLIYNTITFSVVQRRDLIGRLRALGVTRREIFGQVLFEALLLGAAGAVLGVLLGIVLAQGLVRLVTQTINDLYYVLDVRSVALEPIVLVKGVLLGVAATLAAAVPPAHEAASAPVNVVLQRSEEERKMRRRLPGLSLAGLTFGIAAVVVLVLSGRNLVLSYVGLALILGSFALLTPVATLWMARAARVLLGGPFGLIGRMAAQGVAHHLSRTSVAIAALSIAVAAAIGVGVMVGSFRDTVVDWLDYTLQADLYVQPPSSVFRLGQGYLDEELVRRLEGLEGVTAVSSVRRMDLTLESGRINLAALDSGLERPASFRFASGEASDVWNRFTSGRAVVVSEPLSYRLGVVSGDSLELPTDRGRVRFRIAGVYYDYGSDQGVVAMTRALFSRYYDARGLSGISIHAAPDADLDALAERIRAAAEGDVVIRSNRGLREASLEVFDRTFAITTVLRVLALLVAFAGVLSALMALQIERAGEFGILRAEGMTPGQMSGYLTLQTGVMGVVAGLLAVPLGMVLAYVLIFVINKRSFGWTLDFSAPPEILLQAVVVAVVAAVLAGLYPSWSLARSNTAEALRTE